MRAQNRHNWIGLGVCTVSLLAASCAVYPPNDPTPTDDSTVIDPSDPDDSPLIPSINPGGIVTAVPAAEIEAKVSYCCNALSFEFRIANAEEAAPQGSRVAWEFGDGFSGSGLATSHTFLWPGEYTLVVRITLVDGASRESKFSLAIWMNSSNGTNFELKRDHPAGPGNWPGDEAGQFRADAGPDLFAVTGRTVIIDGARSVVPDGEATAWQWRQVSGAAVTLSAVDRPQSSFTAPEVREGSMLLEFALLVSTTGWSDVDFVRVNVLPTESAIAQTVFDPWYDGDLDGLSDAWEVAYFGSADITAGVADYDGDGVSNLKEYRLRTNPTRSDRVQIALNEITRSARAFVSRGSHFRHVRDGELIGWPMFRTVDASTPPLWCVDDGICAETPVISVMGPGTPDVGLAMLRLYQVTGNRWYLRQAIQVGRTLLSVQQDLERTGSAQLRSPLERGGWINHAVVIPSNNDTRVRLPREVGCWTSVRTDEAGGPLYLTRDHVYMTFDDLISTNPATYLLELHVALQSAGAAALRFDGLPELSPTVFLDGADRFFDLCERYRVDYVLRRSDFDTMFLTYGGLNREKDGLHPFIAYLANLPAHPLNQGAAYRPYALGGIPQGIGEVVRLLGQSGEAYGARTAGYTLHKTINDHVMSGQLLFLWRYYKVTGDPAALANLELQLSWLVRVFEAHGARGWCQQYHVLDDACAPGRPWEPVAFAMREGIKLIRRIAFVERAVARDEGLIRPDVRSMLEDAVFYLDRVIPRDEPDKLFQYYSLADCDAATSPSCLPALAADEPVFTCDFYYPEDPFRSCGYGGSPSPPQLVGIDESINGEFVGPDGLDWLADVSHGGLPQYLIADECVNDAAAASWSGCLDLEKPYALARSYYDWDRMYWDLVGTPAVNDLVDRPANGSGLWTVNRVVRGRDRLVIRTDEFVHKLVAAARLFETVQDQLRDRDSDGLDDLDERRIGSDPSLPDTDYDGLLDGDEVHLFGTDPRRADTDGDGCDDAMEVEGGQNPLYDGDCS